MDRVGADFWNTIDMVKQRLGARPVAIQIPIGVEAGFEGVIDLVEEKRGTSRRNRTKTRKSWTWPTSSLPRPRLIGDHLIETLAEVDDQAMISYVEATSR